jgi:hypothetical protein
MESSAHLPDKLASGKSISSSGSFVIAECAGKILNVHALFAPVVCSPRGERRVLEPTCMWRVCVCCLCGRAKSEINDSEEAGPIHHQLGGRKHIARIKITERKERTPSPRSCAADKSAHFLRLICFLAARRFFPAQIGGEISILALVLGDFSTLAYAKPRTMDWKN